MAAVSMIFKKYTVPYGESATMRNPVGVLLDFTDYLKAGSRFRIGKTQSSTQIWLQSGVFVPV